MGLRLNNSLIDTFLKTRHALSLLEIACGRDTLDKQGEFI